MRNILFSLGLLMIVFSCNDKSQDINKTDSSTKVESQGTFFEKKLSFGDLQIEIKKDKDNFYILNNLDSNVIDVPSFKGNIDEMIVTDVDGNGFDEFYCISNTGDLVAFSSYKNKSFGEIYVKEKPNAFYSDNKKVKYWELKNKKLLITFSTEKEDKLNTVRYRLEKGETSFILDTL